MAAASRNKIVLAAPAAAGDPPNFSRVPSPVLVSFGGSTKPFAEAVPFLPWSSSGAARSTVLNVPYHLLEALLLPVCSFEDAALSLNFMLHGVSVPRLAKILSCLVDDGLTLHTFSSAGSFTEAAAAVVAEAPNPSAYILKASDFWSLEPASPASDLWLSSTSWKHWLPSPSVPSARQAASFFISLLGDRSKADDRELAAGRFALLCRQFLSSFNKQSDSVDLPVAFLGPLVTSWLLSVPWPTELMVLVSSDEQAFQEMRFLMISAAGSAAQRSAVLRSCLPRAFLTLQGTAAFLSGSSSSSDVDLLLPLLSRLQLESTNPIWADFLALDDALLVRVEISSSVPDSAHAPQLRQKLLLDDFEAERRTAKLRSSFQGSSGVEDLDSLQRLSSISVDHALALNNLRRSKPLLKLVRKLEKKVANGSLTREGVFKLAFKSRISSVVRYFLGILSSLDLHPVFPSLSSLRLSKFKRDSTVLNPLGKYLGAAVVCSIGDMFQGSLDRLASFSLSADTVFYLLTGKWGLVDWEQALVLNVSLARAGKPQKPGGRKKDTWFISETLLSDLVAPMTALLSAIGYSDDPQEVNSFASIVSEAISAFRLARLNEDCAAMVTSRARDALHKALADSAEGWSLFFLDASPWAEFPETVLPESSSCFDLLRCAKKTSNTMVDLVADGFEEVLESLMQRKRLAAGEPSVDPTSAKKDKKAKAQAPSSATLSVPSSRAPSAQLSASNASASAKADGAFKPFYLVDEAADLLQLSKSQYVLSKVKAHFGSAEKCWAVVITNKDNPEEACPCPGTPGHKPGDPLHLVDASKRASFRSHRLDFINKPPRSSKPPLQAGNERP